MRLIEELEDTERGRYSGPVGWVDWHGEGEWCIALRSAQLPTGGPGPHSPARVFGGGGIMPDVFIPADTTDVTKYFVEVAGRNILYRYTIEYADRHREALNAVKTIDELQTLLDSDKTLVDDFVRYAARKGVAPRYGDIARSRRLIEAQLRAYIGRNTALEDNGFYANIYPVDNVVVRAIGILKEENEND